MIVFAPSYDEQTRACAPVAAHVAAHTNGYLLQGDEARRNLLLGALRDAQAGSCMFFAHGDHEGIYCEEDEKALAVADLAYLPKLTLFAYACHSAHFFQRAADRERITWGYDMSMVPPPYFAVRRDDVETVFRFIGQRFATCTSLADVMSVIEDVRDVCDRCMDKYVRNGESTVAAMVFFSQIWTRLRVWTPWEDFPIKHSSAWNSDVDDIF